jgi:membrane protease YdiL (CAAX protease family)
MSRGIVRLAIVFEGGLLMLALGLGWVLKFPFYDQVAVNRQAVVWGAVATAPPLLLMWMATRTQWGPLLRIMRQMKRLLPQFAACSYLELALISLLAGVAEEALFRGVIQTSLAAWLPPWAALVIASALFGLGHFITPMYALLAGLLGLYLGGLAMIYDNLLLVMVVHALYDFVALVYLVRKYKQDHKASGG